MPPITEDFTAGLQPLELPTTPSTDSSLSCLVWGAVIASLIVLPIVWQLFLRFFSSLSRANIVRSPLTAGERTFSERLCQVLAMASAATFWGLLLYSTAFTLRHGDMILPPLQSVAAIAAAAAAAMLLQNTGAAFVAYVFAAPEAVRPLTRATSAINSLQAYAILLPALAAFFAPANAPALTIAAGCIYFLLRILLWIKHIRIFFNGPFSILYFFLYLCTLEVVPIMLPLIVATLI